MPGVDSAIFTSSRTTVSLTQCPFSGQHPPRRSLSVRAVPFAWSVGEASPLPTESPSPPRRPASSHAGSPPASHLLLDISVPSAAIGPAIFTRAFVPASAMPCVRWDAQRDRHPHASCAQGLYVARLLGWFLHTFHGLAKDAGVWGPHHTFTCARRPTGAFLRSTASKAGRKAGAVG